MALEGDMKYEEISACCESVVALFSDKADVAAVRESGRMIADLHATQEERHKEVCEAIRELTGQLNKAKTDHAERKSTLLDETQKQQLLAERTRVDDNIRRLVLEGDGLRQSIAACDAQANELSAREQQLRQAESVEVPRARHTISLYANISSIRWDFSSPAIKGWVTSSSGAGMKAFEMEANHKHTEFAITNYLWDLMDNI